MLKPVLLKLAMLLNSENVLWAVGGSLVLNHYGLGAPANDIDLLVGLRDIENVEAILSGQGIKRHRDDNETYATCHFIEYTIDHTEIDVISGLRINHASGCYKYSFRKDSVDRLVKIGNVDIPIMALEDWYVLYQMIPGRELKADLIENYLRTHGIRRRDLLDRACQGELPDRVRLRIERFQQRGEAK